MLIYWGGRKTRRTQQVEDRLRLALEMESETKGHAEQRTDSESPTAVEEGVHVVGLSILSGSHVPLVGEVMGRMRSEGLDDVPVVVGGIIQPEDEAKLRALGVAAVYTPKNFQLNAIMREIVDLVDGLAEAA